MLGCIRETFPNTILNTLKIKCESEQLGHFQPMINLPAINDFYVSKLKYYENVAY